jgi:hypothetical protein
VNPRLATILAGSVLSAVLVGVPVSIVTDIALRNYDDWRLKKQFETDTLANERGMSPASGWHWNGERWCRNASIFNAFPCVDDPYETCASGFRTVNPGEELPLADLRCP